jgi:4-carboxymuconolactone decarboxylase
MTTNTPHDAGLGGRLPLLAPSELDHRQARLREELVGSRGFAGFEIQLPDGRLIGPFNAYLHAPEIGQALRGWAAAIDERNLAADVQQAAVLTLGASWDAAYEIYAHTAEARRAGIPEQAIAAIVAGRPPVGLSPPADVAHHLARALAVEHAVGDTLYQQAIELFGVEDLIALVNLIGRYMNTAAMLACFSVPVPEGCA